MDQANATRNTILTVTFFLMNLLLSFHKEKLMNQSFPKRACSTMKKTLPNLGIQSSECAHFVCQIGLAHAFAAEITPVTMSKTYVAQL